MTESTAQNWKHKKILGLLLQPKRVLMKLLSAMQRSPLMPPRLRVVLVALMGVNLIDRDTIFIGENVYFDELHPELITLHKNVYLTAGCSLLTHHYDTSKRSHSFSFGEIVIEDNVFIGMNVIFTAPSIVGMNSVIGANSVVTGDIKPNVICGGVPCKTLKTRNT